MRVARVRSRWHVVGVAGALAAFIACAGESPPEEASAAPAAWELVWADEFDGERLDRESWTVEVMPDPHNEELQYYPDRADDAPGANVWLEDGHLVIEARREDYEHRRYTSARINTQGKREFLFGRFEARIKLPAAVGTWPAFWLLGGNLDEVGWPACGEIDILEGKGRLANWTSGAIHSGPDPGSNRVVSFAHLLERGDLQSAWHRYAVEWAATEIRWILDDSLLYTIRRPIEEDPVYWPFDHGHPFFVILNLALGGWFDQGHPPPDGMTPQRLLVDWVRVYQKPESGAAAAP